MLAMAGKEDPDTRLADLKVIAERGPNAGWWSSSKQVISRLRRESAKFAGVPPKSTFTHFQDSGWCSQSSGGSYKGLVTTIPSMRTVSAARPPDSFHDCSSDHY